MCIIRYGRAPEGVTVGDERKLLPTRKTPVLIVGTKTDLPCHVRSEHRVWVDKAIDDYRASEIRLVSHFRPCLFLSASSLLLKTHAYCFTELPRRNGPHTGIGEAKNVTRVLR